QAFQKAGDLVNTEPDLLGGGEKSRYIHQISAELPLWNPGIKIRERFLHSPFPKGEAFPPITIAKEGDIPEKLLQKARGGFSPTAINAYRKCPLRFYFSEVAGLREPDEVEDIIDPKTLGNAVHDTLHNLYQSVKGIPLTSMHIKSMTGQADRIVDKAFKEKYKGSAIAYGKNLLLVNVAKIMVRNFLKSQSEVIGELEEKGQTLTVTMLEDMHRGRLSVPFRGRLTEVWIKGVVDRVDYIGDERQVIDYKTGICEKKELRIASWDDLAHNPLLDKGFQLLCYVWLLPLHGKNTLTRAGIVSLSKPGNGFMTVQVPKRGAEAAVEAKNQQDGRKERAGLTDILTMSDKEEIETVLTDLLTEIFDVNIPFQQTEEPEICRRCPYLMLCQR
ncbi:MAG: PD-(D/E)XK nuclease family protein, partial [Bacteroidota bacterium]